MECTHGPKLDPRVRRTRKLLEDAFHALVSERPYEAISVGDIAERATVNRATFYAHFEDKRDLAAKTLRGCLETELLASFDAPPEFNAENLEKVAVTVFRFMARTLGGCPKHVDEFAPHVAPTLQEAIQAFLRHWLDRDPDAMRSFPGAAKDTVATVLGWSLYGAAFRWSRLSRKPPADKAACEVVALLL